MNSTTLVSLLKACGEIVEELGMTVTPVGDSLEIMEAIRTYCKQLSVIHIENLRDVFDMIGEESYSSLIRSYGSRLKYAYVYQLSLAHLAKTVNACTNLQLKVMAYWLFEESIDWQRAYHLGPRMDHLHLSPDLIHGDEC